MEFQISAIDPAVVRELLKADDAGRAPRVSVDETGGAPVRCCLRKAAAGERIALVSYAPLRRWAAATGADPGAYDEQGPIFLHADPCPGRAEDGWPAAHTSPRVLRAYSADGRIHGGRVLPEGADPEVALKEVFADPEVAVVHVRAIEYGCFHFEAARPALT
ncbi:DUF1203 domain-containing protein [Nonomuraea typhae]|uniref:DUF1203 domain-containing protein n=1 Tax=Nonomuraea typhae TaxID=2603600 RepID=UPI0012F8CC13|nr:DUF1203 domain-containing protein [Nonomuraea typhae]